MDEYKKTQAKKLPAGWEWCDWEDGSGGLYAPDGHEYYGYDIIPYAHIGEIEYRPTPDARWTTFAGTLSEYKARCEDRILEAMNEQNQSTKLEPRIVW